MISWHNKNNLKIGVIHHVIRSKCKNIGFFRMPTPALIVTWPLRMSSWSLVPTIGISTVMAATRRLAWGRFICSYYLYWNDVFSHRTGTILYSKGIMLRTFVLLLYFFVAHRLTHEQLIHEVDLRCDDKNRYQLSTGTRTSVATTVTIYLGASIDFCSIKENFS